LNKYFEINENRKNHKKIMKKIEIEKENQGV